ncbi:hypothetical protein [Actinomycetospora sp. NBC_00405]|uniref:hypothetical protein n=1 Tax=Actinomycetospora sp. NBC_00405 TaxID=2975952 RepID=UPI002E1CEE70
MKETSASLSADVTATATGAGKLEVSFGGEGDFALRAANVNSTRINNIVAVEDSISELLSLGTWKRNWVYVQEVVVGAPCIFLVASARSKHAAVQAAASGDQALSFAAQMDARAGFRVESDDTLSYEIADLGPTPFMWRGRCLRSWPSRSMTDRGDGSESAFKELIEYDQGIDDEDDDL